MKEPAPVGIDVAARELVVTTSRGQWVFENMRQGHRRLIRKLTKGSAIPGGGIDGDLVELPPHRVSVADIELFKKVTEDAGPEFLRVRTLYLSATHGAGN